MVHQSSHGALAKKVVAHAKETIVENRASGSQSKGKGNKKARASPPDESAAAGTDSQSSASKKAKIGFQAWKDRFNGSKKN